MNLLIVKLNFHSGLHVHRGNDNYSTSEVTLFSDTIWSAIYSSGERLNPGFGEKMQKVRVSTCYPFIHDMLFWPVPIGRENIEVKGYENAPAKANKVLKRVQYLETPFFEKILLGQKLILGDDNLRHDGKFVSSKAFPIPSKRIVQQRVKVSRDFSDTETFYVERIFFNDGAGLFFVLDAPDEYLESILEVIYFLGEEGVGTDRNVGNGVFSPSFERISINTPESSQYFLSLGMFLPCEADLKKWKLDKSYYKIVARGGYIAGAKNVKHRHLRKKKVHMLVEGSILNCSDALTGAVCNLRPDWNDASLEDIFRSGKTVFLPLTLN